MASLSQNKRSNSSEDVVNNEVKDVLRSKSNIDTKSRKNEPISLLSALHKKYSTANMRSQHCIIFLTSNAPGKTASGGLRVPESITLDASKISSAGDGENLSEICADVTELDLTDNNISSWTEVFSILDSMPKLVFLNLTKNPLAELDFVHTTCYHNVKKIALNFTSLSWNTVKNLLAVIPNLEELYLSGNNYEAITLDVPCYTSLSLLQLTYNSLQDWAYIKALDQVFPNLTNLIIAYNNISICGTGNDNSAILRNLKILNMNNTAVSDWDELDKLSSIRSLSDIRLASIPLLENLDDVKRRQLLSVYFPHVERLNGSSLTVSERETAERVFLRYFMNQSSKPKRYAMLEAKHGILEPLASVNLSPRSTVAMKVVCGDKEETFDIPTKQTVGQLRRSLKKFTGSTRFKLYHHADDGQGPNELKLLNRYVWALNFQDGETLICDVVPSSPVKSDPPSPRDNSSCSTFEVVPESPTKEPPLKRR